MGEATLVRQDASEGALLVEWLDASGLRLSAAFWAHDADLGLWRLILAVPRSSVPSPRDFYALIQEAINELNLSLPLDRVTFILDTAPLVGTLRDFAVTASTDVVEVPLAGADIAGAPIDTAYAYRVDAIRYEKELFAALQRVRPPEAVLRRGERVLPDDGFDFDFVVDSGLRMVLIVAKSLPRRLAAKDIRWIIANFHRTVSIGYTRAALMIISKTGFATEDFLVSLPYEEIRGTGIALVKWAGAEDDTELQIRLAQFVGN